MNMFTGNFGSVPQDMVDYQLARDTLLKEVQRTLASRYEHAAS